MIYDIKENDRNITLTVEGELELQSINELRERILRLAETTAKDIAVDLSKVDYIDSTGIALLISLQRRQVQKGNSLKITSVSPRIQSLLQLTTLSDIVS
jgi:anti-sigma B factor antagonist